MTFHLVDPEVHIVHVHHGTYIRLHSTGECPVYVHAVEATLVYDRGAKFKVCGSHFTSSTSSSDVPGEEGTDIIQAVTQKMLTSPLNYLRTCSLCYILRYHITGYH